MVQWFDVPRNRPNSAHNNRCVARQSKCEEEGGDYVERQNKIRQRRKKKRLHARWCRWVRHAEIGSGQLFRKRNLSSAAQQFCPELLADDVLTQGHVCVRRPDGRYCTAANEPDR